MLRLREESQSMAEIAKLMECSKKKVFSAIHFEEKQETRGRRRATSKNFDTRLIRKSKKEPFLSSRDLKNYMNASLTSRTIRNRLIENDLKAHSARRVPFLNKKHVEKRVCFAKRHEIRKNWKNVLWSDETKINLFGSDGRPHVRRPKNTAFDPRYTKKTIKHGGGNIMLWGCFSASGVGPLYWIQGNMCAPDYVNILNEVMLPYAEENMPLKWELVQDNDPKHSSKLAKKWFLDNEVGVMDWPAQSPDLNPIEHLWGVLKKRLSGFQTKNKDDLWKKVQEE